jgi:Phosphotransferase enzyme family
VSEHLSSSAAMAAELRTCLERGEFDGLAAAYVPDAALDASLPGRRVRARAPAAIVSELVAAFPEPGVLVEWSVGSYPEGAALWLERVAADGSAVRQRHYLHVRDGRIAVHWIYAAPPQSGRHEDEASESLARALARLGRVVDRQMIASSGWSGAPIVRVRLADGRALVAKKVEPRSGWIGRNTRDPGREALLFLDGVLDRMPDVVDPTVVAVQPDGEGWWLLSRDVTSRLVGDRARLSREQSHLVLRAAGSLWEAHWERPVAHLCTLADRLGLASPKVAERERAGLDLLPKQFEAAWEAFAEVVEAEVATAVVALADDPSPLAAALEAQGTTLIHGDLRDEHIGFEAGRLVLIDWGLATRGHPAVELAWYLAHTAWRVDATRDEIVDDFRSVCGERHDEGALRLGILAGLVLYGWIFGHSALIHPDPAERAWARDELAWWVPRARAALETLSLSSPRRERPGAGALVPGAPAR